MGPLHDFVLGSNNDRFLSAKAQPAATERGTQLPIGDVHCHGEFRRVSGPSSDVGLPRRRHITAHNARRGRGIGRRRSECTHRSDWMSAATMPNWILDSEMKGDGRPSGPWASWTIAVAVLSSGMALPDPTRTHRRQHRLCYDYAIMLFSFSAVPSVGSAKLELRRIIIMCRFRRPT
jgi:hypothetical protein